MTNHQEIAFVDPSIPHLGALLAGLRHDIEPIVLSRTEPAILQMARTVRERTKLDAIHVIAHGRPGEVSFAAGALSAETLDGDTAELADLGRALGSEGGLFLWACEAGRGTRGAAFVEALARRTGASVAAATGPVGARSLGGNWSLDRGAAPSRDPLTAAGASAYPGLLATFTGGNGNDVADASKGTLTGFAGGTQAQLTDSSGDIFTGGAGADTIVAGSGDDTINIGNGQFVAGESINGGGNTGSGTRDQIVLTNSGTTVDFSVGTVSGVETLTGSGGNDTVTMTAAQLATFSAINLGGGTDVLNVLASGNISALALPTISVETGNLTGTANNDAVTLSGAQLDAIVIGSGTINLGSGTGDTINLTSTSADLNTLGTNNNSIQGVEAISAAGAAAGVTITLSGQSEAFTITGSNQADTITGGTGADTINSGSGNDTITGGTGADNIDAGSGDDTINVGSGQFVAGEAIQGGTNSGSGTRDQIVLTSSGTTVDFSLGTVSGVETLTGSGGNDTVTMTAAQLAAFSAINLGGGTDVLNVVASGNISALALPTISVETGNLTGTANNDAVTLSGAQLDAVLIGSGTINLGSGTGDTINLTSTSADLNTLGTNNNSIQGVEAISAAGAAAGVTITLSGQSEAFTITGSNQADTITGGTGADSINAGSGDDTINVGNGQFVTGEAIQGGADSGSGTRDQIVLTSSGTTVDFSVGTVSGVETLTGSGGNDTVTMTAAQLAAFSAINLGGGTDVLNVLASGNISALALPAISVETGNLTGTANNDAVTLSGAQLDAIVIGTGTINLGSGTGDTINLTSTSADLNTLGANNNSIQGVEAISAAGAAAGVTITLSGQSEAFTITGSNQADTITGGTGADSINAGSGDDTINVGSGQFVAGDVIQGGADSGSGTRDQIVLTSSGTTVDFTVGTVSGVETLTGSGGNDTVTMTAAQLAAFSAINLGGGTDVLNVVAGGNISALALPAISVETGNLTGTANNDAVTLSGAQLDAIVNGAGTINLGSGTGDTINLTSTSNKLNSLNDASISGVEAISAAGAAAGVTITLSGQSEAFTITGSNQADTITGGLGADSINAGSGADMVAYHGSDISIAGGGDIDTLVVAGAASIDLSLSDQSIGDTALLNGFENVDASGSTVAVSLLGSSGANVLTGGQGADIINSRTGADTVNGGAGNDTISYDGSNASLTGGADSDTLVVSGAVTIDLSLTDQTLGDLVNVSGFENVDANGSTATVNLKGNGLANVLIGGSASDAFAGGGGNDTIEGGAGTDTVSFSGARSDYTVAVSGSTFTVTDKRGGSPDGTDTVTNVENFQFSDATYTAAEVSGQPPVPPPNKIVAENMKQGNPISEWGLATEFGYGDDGQYTSIQGFATEISTNVGQTVDFKIATDSTNYRIDIYRLGYYGGDGARKVATIQQSLTTAQIQPHPIVDMDRGLIDAGNWDISASWQIPEDAVSGVYIAKLVRQDGTEAASHIPFIVRDDASTSDIVFQTSDTTWQAYNEWGGASLYFGEVPVDPEHLIGHIVPNCGCAVNAIGRATAVSYNRPIVTNTSGKGGTHDFIFGVEHSAIRWLEENGYDVSYISGLDTTRSGSTLLNHDAFLSVGHDEYWSAEQRANVEAARDQGVNLAFWSGNEIYWKVRWETSIDGNGTPYRTMVCYKETWGGTPDPTDVSTGTWRDVRFAEPGQEPENALTGTMFTVDSYRLDTITIPYDYSNLRFWRNTDVADLLPGQTYSLVQNLLGYEWDSDVENGFRPAGLINMSLSTVSVDTYLEDYGTTVGSANVSHSLTMYRAESGALVFGAGTVFWSWGLDDQHEGAETPEDQNVKQAMVNMFADMGIQPGSLDASLILASQSTDTIKPIATITPFGTNFAEGQKVTITGTAQDFGGGLVAGVEISLDGGQSWWKTVGRESWSYSWVVQAAGSYNIMARAVDDSLNLGDPSATAAVSVALPATSSLWTLSATPEQTTVMDKDDVELGVRFQATTTGNVQGIRFYKGFYNAGEHVVNLWTETGTLLATGVSVGEPISGWQTVNFASPVHIASGTTYVASYHTKGWYSANDNYFTSTYQNGLLKVMPQGGVYAYSSTPGVFPSQGSSNANYWVDVVFAPDPNVAPVAGDDSGFTIGKNGMIPISFASLLTNDGDANQDPLTISAVGNATNGSVSLDALTGNVIFTPTAGYSGSASFTYTVSDGRGGTDTADVSLTVEEDPAGVSLFQWTEGPTGPGFADPNGVELGMKFSSAVNGSITGIRFYKMANDGGPHTGSLWSSTGTLLATVTFTNESFSGWQTATFSNPVEITKGTVYVASYHTNGVYAASANYFVDPKINGSLSAPSSASSGGNGIYTYSPGTAFPTSGSLATNYWVDVILERSSLNSMPLAGNDNGFTVSNSGLLSIASAALLANDSDPDGDPITITSVGNATNGSVSLNQQTGAITFTPTTGFIGPASFSYTISDGREGTASAVVNVSVGQSDTTVNLFSPSNTPSILSVNDPGSVELGVKFQTSSPGIITGMRYWKSAQDIGTHTGSLWTSTGTLLANATFTNESASGWQTVTFTQPIAVSAGITYVASYHSNGFYGVTPNFFATNHTNGPLMAPASSGISGGNGVFAYGSGTLFPSATYGSSNYWVDVLYEQVEGNLRPVAGDDLGFFASFNTPLALQASTLLANDIDANNDPLTITGVGNAVNGTVSFENNVVTFTPNENYSGIASFTYTMTDGNNETDTAEVVLSVDPAGGTKNLFGSAAPATAAANDSGDVELGMKFQSDVAGVITGIRFYKAPENVGPHQAHLWTENGTLLASATFINETESGWQAVSLSQEVAIQADTTYVVSYHSDGFYSATPGFFNTEFANQDLSAPSSALSGGNGVYAYGPSGLFPTNSFSSTNYHVDVAFKPQLAA